MYNLLRSELLKLKYSKFFKNLTILIIVFIALTVILSKTAPYFNLQLMYTNTIDRDYGFATNIFINQLNPMGFEYFKSAVGWTPILLIALLFLIGYFVADEYKNGNYKNTIAYGHKRENIYISKLIAICVGITILEILLYTVPTILGTIINGWGIPFKIKAISEMVSLSLVISIIMMSIASIGMFLSTLTKSKSVVIVIGICALIATCFTIGKSGIEMFTINNPMYMLMDVCIKNPDIENIRHIIISCIISIIIFTTLGITTFKQQDIK